MVCQLLFHDYKSTAEVKNRLSSVRNFMLQMSYYWRTMSVIDVNKPDETEWKKKMIYFELTYYLFNYVMSFHVVQACRWFSVHFSSFICYVYYFFRGLMITSTIVMNVSWFFFQKACRIRVKLIIPISMYIFFQFRLMMLIFQ